MDEAIRIDGEERNLGAEGVLEAGIVAGGLRWAAVDLTAPLEEARFRMDFSPIAAAALGRALAGAALLLRLTSKTPSRLVVEVVGDGPIRRVIAEADPEGNLRGMVGDPRVELPAGPDGKLPVGRAVGRGSLRVLREYPRGGHYHSQVELVSGEIGEDLAHFLAQSEQSRSVVALGVLARPWGVAAAGGLLVEALPDAEPAVIERLADSARRLGGVSRLTEEGGVEGLRDAFLGELAPQVEERSAVRYHCRCSRDRLRQHLVVLAAEDASDFNLEGGTTEAECAFCGIVYRFTAAELRPM